MFVIITKTGMERNIRIKVKNKNKIGEGYNEDKDYTRRGLRVSEIIA